MSVSLYYLRERKAIYLPASTMPFLSLCLHLGALVAWRDRVGLLHLLGEDEDQVPVSLSQADPCLRGPESPAL